MQTRQRSSNSPFKGRIFVTLKHIQEILCRAQQLVGILTVSVPGSDKVLHGMIRLGRYGGEFGDQADRL